MHTHHGCVHAVPLVYPCSCVITTWLQCNLHCSLVCHTDPILSSLYVQCIHVLYAYLMNVAHSCRYDIVNALAASSRANIETHAHIYIYIHIHVHVHCC